MGKSETRRRGFRVERDPVGEKKVPADAMYGIQTARALENFPISGLRVDRSLITAMAQIKRAAAETHRKARKLDGKIADAIARAASEVADGRWAEEFDLDAFQAGAGTSYHMNVNEVVANRALELLGRERGDYEHVHPIDHVNKAQSTNDVMPTAMRIAAVRLLRDLLDALDALAGSFAAKAKEFKGVRKAGRTHLHDATPMTLGEEFGAYAENLRRAAGRLRALEDSLLEVPLGGTAVGNGVNSYRGYAKAVVSRAARLTGLPLREARDRVALTQSVGDFVALSAALRAYALELSKIANDLRLLSSGPHTALYEIELPAVQPGSSIMPGKVNPAMAEMVNMVCFHVAGHDAAIGMCAEAGQLEVNVMMPYIAYALLESLAVMASAARAFDERCVRVIRAHPDRCAHYAECSVGLAALHNERLGFMGAAELAKKAEETGRPVGELAGE
ncbi:MAG TPA: aspartate ammonia-lyase [Gemmatimonadaceae bacterium]|nr:aspartate ammonia-lyase [Gemmatimonadaceae bacterium]